MDERPPTDATQMLRLAADGDQAAAFRLGPLVYDELRRIAAGYLGRERPEHSLQPTALAHEAWLKMVDQTRAQPKDRGHFLALAAQAMRRILIDHARRAHVRRRDTRISVSELTGGGAAFELDLLELDGALERLAQRSARQARVVELRFFGGLTVEDAADVLDVSPRTVKDDWRVARAWLSRELSLREPEQ